MWCLGWGFCFFSYVSDCGFFCDDIPPHDDRSFFVFGFSTISFLLKGWKGMGNFRDGKENYERR